MSITNRGVTIQKRGKNYWILIILTGIELIFSFLLIVSLASNLLFPQRASAVAGVSAKLSYQGRLTDLSGNPLGGTGTNYCFRFSIYDAAAVGTKVWPAGVPASTTVKVEDGVFNTDIGTADSLASFDFSSVDTLYLNVEVNATPTTCSGAWEQLDLRQRIDSVGYARAAEGVYSSLLRAPTGGTAVQIGTGAGAATPIFLNLDVKNTDGAAVDSSCSTNGQVWYNSFDSKARICQGSVIRDLIDGILVKDEGTNRGRASTALDFTGGGVSASKDVGGVININIPFQGVAVNAAGTVSSGVVVFSNSNNVTFGINGSTITASITAAGGGGGNTASFYANAPFVGNSSAWQVSGSTSHVQPFFLPYAISASYIRLPVTMSDVGSLAAVGTAVNVTRGLTVSSTLNVVVYSQNTGVNSLSLQSVASGSASWVQRATIQAAGVGSNWSSGHTISYPVTGGNSSFTLTGAATSASFTMQSSQLSNFTNLRYLDIPFANSLAAGPYWIMYGSSTSMSTSGTANMSTLRILVSNFVMTQPAQSLNILGNATNSSNHFQIGLGSWTTNVMATSASVALSGISRSASNPQLYFQIIRQN